MGIDGKTVTAKKPPAIQQAGLDEVLEAAQQRDEAVQEARQATNTADQRQLELTETVERTKLENENNKEFSDLTTIFLTRINALQRDEVARAAQQDLQKQLALQEQQRAEDVKAQQALQDQLALQAQQHDEAVKAQRVLQAQLALQEQQRAEDVKAQQALQDKLALQAQQIKDLLDWKADQDKKARELQEECARQKAEKEAVEKALAQEKAKNAAPQDQLNRTALPPQNPVVVQSPQAAPQVDSVTSTTAAKNSRPKTTDQSRSTGTPAKKPENNCIIA